MINNISDLNDTLEKAGCPLQTALLYLDLDYIASEGGVITDESFALSRAMTKEVTQEEADAVWRTLVNKFARPVSPEVYEQLTKRRQTNENFKH